MKGIKMLTLCLVILFLAVGTSHAASMTVTSPKAGEACKLGEPKDIEWNYSGSEAGNQRWKLLKKGGTDLGTIADRVAGSRYSWSVGEYTGDNATPAGDYKMHVLNGASSQIRSNNGAFTISIPAIAQKMEGPKQPRPITPAPKSMPPAKATPKSTPPAKAGPKSEPAFSAVGHPIIREVKGLAAPSRALEIRGQDFGTTRGEVRLYGDFTGGNVGLHILKWDERYIQVTVPSGISGVKEHQARIRVERSDRKDSPDWPITFYPEMEATYLPSSAITHSCWESSRCMGDAKFSFSGSSRNCSDDNARAGRDIFYATLKNGWHFSGKIHDFSVSGYGKANTEGTQLPYKGTSMTLVVNWRIPEAPSDIGIPLTPIDVVDRGCLSLYYHGNIGIIGPKGVPFQ